MIATREAWLLNAVDAFRPWFDQAEKPLPSAIRVSVGFPLGSRKAIGQCWHADGNEDKAHHIFISPVLADEETAAGVLATLLHECAHAALPLKTGHRKPFAKLCETLGLAGPWTATTATPDLQAKLAGLVEDLGEFPHAALNMAQRKGQKNRHIKCECISCKYIARVAQKHLDAHGAPICPGCSEPMHYQGEEDESEDNHGQ